MEIKYLAGGPTPGDASPAFYETDRGTYLIQGYRVPEEYRSRVHRLVEHEDVVEIPKYLVEAIRRSA
jgi:hypothetical protein